MRITRVAKLFKRICIKEVPGKPGFVVGGEYSVHQHQVVPSPAKYWVDLPRGRVDLTKDEAESCFK